MSYLLNCCGEKKSRIQNMWIFLAFNQRQCKLAAIIWKILCCWFSVSLFVSLGMLSWKGWRKKWTLRMPLLFTAMAPSAAMKDSFSWNHREQFNCWRQTNFHQKGHWVITEGKAIVYLISDAFLLKWQTRFSKNVGIFWHINKGR